MTGVFIARTGHRRHCSLSPARSLVPSRSPVILVSLPTVITFPSFVDLHARPRQSVPPVNVCMRVFFFFFSLSFSNTNGRERSSRRPYLMMICCRGVRLDQYGLFIHGLLPRPFSACRAYALDSHPPSLSSSLSLPALKPTFLAS